METAEFLSVQAEYADGTMKDLIEDIRLEYNSSTDFHHVGYTNYRWRIFLSNRIAWNRYEEYQEPFIYYLVQNHTNAKKSMGAGLKKVTLVSHWHYIGDYYDHSPIHRSALYTKTFH